MTKTVVKIYMQTFTFLEVRSFVTTTLTKKKIQVLSIFLFLLKSKLQKEKKKKNTKGNIEPKVLLALE